jgi:hypothetical protein
MQLPPVHGPETLEAQAEAALRRFVTRRFEEGSAPYRETVGKAQEWRRAYGEQVVTAAVLGGVFKVSSLVAAQT